MTQTRHKTGDAAYETSFVKRHRSSKSETNAFELWIYNTMWEIQPQTLRHLFYKAAGARWIEKSSAGYQRLVRVVSQMRRRKYIPFTWFIDSTRWVRKPNTHDNVSAALNDCSSLYRRALWRNQPDYCEVWCEKDTMASILYEVTQLYDVPLMVSRGHSSITYLHNAATNIREKHDIEGKTRTHILYLGDYDAHGLEIESKIADGLREYSLGCPITVKRLAVTEEQVNRFGLETREPKAKDIKAGISPVDVDTLPSQTIQTLCREAIESLIDKKAYDAVRAAEKSERESLQLFIQKFEGGEAYLN